jgi:hypothetical protein
MLRRGLPGLLAICLLATFTAGVATAASSVSSSAKACESSTRVLALLSKDGKCPAHYAKVMLGATGPRGLRGPRGIEGLKGDQGVKGDTGPAGAGALLTEARATSSGLVEGNTITVPGTSVTVTANCQAGSGNAANFYINQGSTSLAFHGIAEAATPSAAAHYTTNTPPTDAQYIANGTSLLDGSVSSYETDGQHYESFIDPNEDNPDSLYLNLLVTVGSTNTAPAPSFTLTAWLTVSNSMCDSDVQITPATAPTS